MNASFTLHQLLLLDADLRSTAARPQLEDREADDDRALRLALEGSVRINRFRLRGVKPLPTIDEVRTWRSRVADLLWRGAFRARHPHQPINQPPRAA